MIFKYICIYYFNPISLQTRKSCLLITKYLFKIRMILSCGFTQKGEIFSDHKTFFLLPDSSTPDTCIFFKIYKEKAKKKKPSNLTEENAVKMSHRIVIDFHPACLKKKRGNNEYELEYNFYHYKYVRFQLPSVEFCYVQKLGVQPSTSPFEHSYGSEELSPK